MKGLPTLTVLGTGFFATTYATLADVSAERRREPELPKFPLVQGRNRRFTSLVTQMHMEACGQALEASGVAPASVRSIFASAGGELETAVAILDGIAESAQVSAARFVQSVHNTPSGVFSIATGNIEPSSTITAGQDSVAAAFFEAALLIAERPEPVLVSFGDEAIPAVFRPRDVYRSLAAAFVVTASGANTDAMRARLSIQTLASPLPSPALPSDLAPSPIGAAIALLRAIENGARGETTLVPLGAISPGRVIACEVSP